jgi:hypothetical protein
VLKCLDLLEPGAFLMMDASPLPFLSSSLILLRFGPMSNMSLSANLAELGRAGDEGLSPNTSGRLCINK